MKVYRVVISDDARETIENMKRALKGKASPVAIRRLAKKLRDGAKKLSTARRGRAVQCDGRNFLLSPITGTRWHVGFEVDEALSIVKILDFHYSGVVISEAVESEDEEEDVSNSE